MSISSQPSSTTTATAITPTINLAFSSFPPTNPTINLPPPAPAPAPAPANPISIPSSFYSVSADFVSNYSTSSSTSSDEEQEQEALLEGRRKRKRKWKWKDFFERLMKEVIQKQEDLQKKFLEAIEKREQERAAREEAWRMQEMARINREREILAHERSIAAAKDAAVMAFLQKMSEHQPPHNANLPPPPPPPPPIQPVLAPPVPAPAPPPPPPPQVAANSMEMTKANSKAEGENNLMGASSSRWPKMEVQALIKLRTSLDAKYQENGPKGPLWEEISAAMRKIGYNRSSKRCKEKWENINKYFKKVKESNKKRPEDSKTCPYFHQLDALYREKNRFENVSPGQIKPENTIPLMVQPEQQWPPQQDPNNPDSGMESDPMDQNQDEEEDKDEDDEEEEGDGNYELVANRPPLPSSMSAAE